MYRSKHLALSVVVVALAGLISACAKPTPVTPDQPAAASAQPAAAPGPASAESTSHPEWFHGSLDGAFAKAKSENKPVLVLWGADWCPYCEALKATVFTRPDVLAQVANMVAIELDGDTPEGQAANDKYHVIGYPTAIIFKPDGTEIARVSGGMDLEQYAATLARVLEDERPIAEVLAAATRPEGPNEHVTPSPEDCRRLGWHGWDLDDLESDEATRTLASQLAVASLRCPMSVAKVRLKARAIMLMLPQQAEALKAGKVQGPGMATSVRELLPLLSNEEEVRGTADILSLADTALYDAVKQNEPAFVDRFHKAWTAAMLNSARDSHFGESERLLAMATAIDAETNLRDDKKVPPDMAAEARKMVTAALSKDSKRATRHDIVNAVRLVYSGLGDDDALYNLLVSEAPKSKASYYYMGTIASIAESRGNKDEALGWLKRAYESSAQAPGARAKYGSRYVKGLTRLAPDDVATIRRVSLEVVQAMNERDSRGAKSEGRGHELTEPLTKWATTPPRKAVVADVDKRLTTT